MTVDRADVGAAARAGGIVFGGKLFAWGARFALAILLARLLGVDGYGLYAIALSVATVASAIAVFGLDAAMIRYVAVFAAREDAGSLRGAVQIGFAIPMALSVVVACVLVIVADPIARWVIGDAGLAPLLRVTALLVPALVLNSLLAATLQGLRHFSRSVMAEQVLQPITRAALLVAFALTGLDPTMALVASLLSTVAVGAAMAVWLRRALPVAASARRPVGEIIRFSLPVYFSNIINTFSGNLQTLLLGALSSVASAGIFAVANQVQLIGTLFHAAIVRGTMPLFAQLHDAAERPRLEQLYQTTSKWTFSLNIPFFLVSIAFPEALLAMFGSEFVDGTQALVILAWGAIVSAATGTSGAMLDMTGHTAMKLINASVSVGLAIGLNLLLIPSLGVVGAAIAAVASIAAVNVLRVVEVAVLESIVPFNLTYLKPIAAGVAALAAGVLVGRIALADQVLAVSALGGIAVLVLVYVVVIRLLGLDEADRFVLGRSVDRLRRGRVIGRRPEPLGDADGAR